MPEEIVATSSPPAPTATGPESAEAPTSVPSPVHCGSPSNPHADWLQRTLERLQSEDWNVSAR